MVVLSTVGRVPQTGHESQRTTGPRRPVLTSVGQERSTDERYVDGGGEGGEVLLRCRKRVSFRGS